MLQEFRVQHIYLNSVAAFICVYLFVMSFVISKIITYIHSTIFSSAVLYVEVD